MKKDRHISFFKRFGKFANPHSTGLKHGLFDIILWKIGILKDKKKRSTPKKIVGITDQHSFLPNKPSVMWVNHSSFLIQDNGENFLTDPVWSKKCSPSRIFGPSRLHKPPISLEKLPRIDYVLISHNHYDHLDKRTVKKLNNLYPNIKWIVPTGLKEWFMKKSITNVYELSWWESASFSKHIITAVPTQHFSGRNIFDYNKSLWAGFIVENRSTKRKFYFVGDTSYNEYDFAEIGKKFGKIDLSLIPIGAYIPRAFTKNIHVDPYEAVKIHIDVKSKFSIAMHWKTFRLSDEPQNLPPYDLHLALKQAKINTNKFIAINPGTYVNW